MRLNLGCGADYRSGWVNVDVDTSYKTDRFLDLEKTPWPWDNSSVDCVLASNVLEHISPRCRGSFIEECHRILRPGGTLIMALPVPEVGSGWDLSHYPVPSWRWHMHPQWRDSWIELSTSASCVGPGKLFPEDVALLLTRFGVARCVDEVTVQVAPA